MKTPPLRTEYWFFELTSENTKDPKVFEAYKKAGRVWIVNWRVNKGPWAGVRCQDSAPKTREEIRAKLSRNQWIKFTQGHREFVVEQTPEAHKEQIRLRYMPREKRRQLLT